MLEGARVILGTPTFGRGVGLVGEGELAAHCSATGSPTFDAIFDRRERGEERTNESHASTTDPDARLYRKGRACGDAAYAEWRPGIVMRINRLAGRVSTAS